jgi:hypothetical protein
MLMLPGWITPKIVEGVREVIAAKPDAPERLPQVKVEKCHEGKSVQILHLGSYDEKWVVLQRLHSEYLPENELSENVPQHEIYLNDPCKAPAEKLKTILRQPVRELE